ncbi:hypothetical protein LPB86_20145 [Pedobacter sp. MC2016-14]|uniref:hypothetical protein n=1 Tax=Pedobacter sp. MC2016-14 TaxID=2897327 RepID=UPI001E4AADEB|nr:hypothetical protein [Pedobacter sp. MC2016-14]MCD0490562.1 hypothetical protein [Pedobacter sp. MC2016-14]
MKKITKLILSNKDVQEILGKGESTAYLLIREIRMKRGLKPYAKINVEEFCEHTNMSLELVLEQLRKIT